MQRSTLFCVPLIAICLAAVGAAADNQPRDIATLEPDYMPLVPVVMSRASDASSTPATASRVHYVAESRATASKAHYVGEAPARATTAYYVTASPAASNVASPATFAAVSPATANRTVYVTQSPVVTSGCGCGTPVVTTNASYQPVGITSGSLPTVVSSTPPAVVTSGATCGPPATLCSPNVCATGTPVVAYRPAVAAPPLPRKHYFGRGLIGQPVVYVSGQPVRNALRWFFP